MFVSITNIILRGFKQKKEVKKWGHFIPPSHLFGISRNRAEPAGMKNFQNSCHIREGIWNFHYFCKNVVRILRTSFDPTSNDSRTFRVYWLSNAARIQSEHRKNIKNAVRMQQEYLEYTSNTVRVRFDCFLYMYCPKSGWKVPRLNSERCRKGPRVRFELSRIQIECTSNT